VSIKHVISVSGGKDSLATLLIAIARFGRDRIIAIFCDTGNEHELTYAYLDYLERTLGITITRLKADFSEQIARKRLFIARDVRHGRDAKGRKLRWSNKAKRRALSVLHPTGNPFLDLCLWKGRFPSRKAQFCTEELKRNMAVGFQLELIEAGHTVVSWQGVRRDESINRRLAPKFESVGGGLYIFRPIVEWTAADVFAFCATHSIDPNPLYTQGMSRVGCMPCINVNKPELKQISIRFGGHIRRISEWERLVSMASKRGFSTFITDAHDAADRREIFADLNIWERVRWATTTRGGRQFSLIPDGPANACSSSYGLCE
jgi:3'-phosphoadenosine 5'-phosphosulfate sulfotransferase (PAPS reductase)/FAD synthetase